MEPFREVISSGSKSKYFSTGRIKLPLMLKEGESADLDLAGAREPQATGSRRSTSRKRDVSEDCVPSEPPSKKRRPGRPYAPPETYAHLAHLPDYLKDNLDGKQRSDPQKLTLTNIFCSCVLWYKVSRAPYTSVMAWLQRPAHRSGHPQMDTTTPTRRTIFGNV